MVSEHIYIYKVKLLHKHKIIFVLQYLWSSYGPVYMYIGAQYVDNGDYIIVTYFQKCSGAYIVWGFMSAFYIKLVGGTLTYF